MEFWLSVVTTLIPFGIWLQFGWSLRQQKAFSQPQPRFEDHGEAYDFREVDLSGQTIGVVFAFKSPPYRYFALRPEKWFDRFSKFLRLTRELQFADPNFDRAFFVDTTDREIIRLLQTRADVRAKLRELVIRLKLRESKLVKIDCENGWFWVRIDFARGTNNTGRFRSDVVTWLVPLLTELRALPVNPQGKATSPSSRAQLPRRIAYVTLMFGLVSCFLILMYTNDRLLNDSAFFSFSTLVSCAPTLFFLIWAQRRAEHSANRHRLMLTWLFVAIPGIVLSTFVVLRSANMVFDFATPRYVAASEARIYGVHKGRAGLQYRLRYVATDPSLEEFTNGIDISHFTYEKLKRQWGGNTSPTLQLRIYRGLFGFEWIDV